MEDEIKKLTNEIIQYFTSNSSDECKKWSLLNAYHSEYLLKKDFSQTLRISYPSILSSLLDVLQRNLFCEKWQENLFDDIFLHGILHESFLVLVKRLEHKEQYGKQKIIKLLEKFVQGSALENLFLDQCFSSSNWDLKYVSKSGVWELVLSALVSLPDRVAKETKGRSVKIFCSPHYESLLLSKVFKVLHSIHESVKASQDCSIEFLVKLTGKLCLLGKADIVAKMYVKKFVYMCETDYIWRRISHRFIYKMPCHVLDPFVTNILHQIPWYGYVEWILGDEGSKNEKVNYLMTFKLLFFRSFKSVVILQNIIGYFASSVHRHSDFNKILDSLLDVWKDEVSLRHQSSEQQMYIASALMICAGWLKKLELKVNSDQIDKVLKGTSNRLKKSENTVQNIGMIIGGEFTQLFDPNMSALEYECLDVDLLNYLREVQKIPSKPDNNIITFEDLKHLEEIEELVEDCKISEENQKSKENLDIELDSDDDLEAYDMSNDAPQSKVKRPRYIRECMMGLINQDNLEWTEMCLRHAEELIKSNPLATEEVAVEMTKVLLHLTDHPITDFVGLRHKILITLTVECPVMVVSYLTSQFTERDYTIRQRLDILEVLAASSVLLAYSSLPETHPTFSSNEDSKTEPEWQLIISQRLEAKTKRYTKAQEILSRENKFSAIAGNFFYPLLNSYEKACKVLKLHSENSYVLGRFINTLAIIMFSASNTLHCSEMGTSLLRFLHSMRMHEDVFVRKSIIFAVAAVCTAVPSSILFTEMCTDICSMSEWLHNVSIKDYNEDCIEKSLFALSILKSAADEDSSLRQLKNLMISM